MAYVVMTKKCHVSKETLAQYPANTVWIDVWHLASASADGNFAVKIRQSDKHFKNYWSGRGVKTLAWKDGLTQDEMIEFCQELHEKLGLSFELFELHGSVYGDSSWLRQKLAKEA